MNHFVVKKLFQCDLNDRQKFAQTAKTVIHSHAKIAECRWERS